MNSVSGIGKSGCSLSLADWPALYERHPAATAFQKHNIHAVSGLLQRGIPRLSSLARSTRMVLLTGARTAVASPDDSVRNAAMGNSIGFHARKFSCRDTANVPASENR